MKANRAHRPFRPPRSGGVAHDDSGVSTVLGGILFLALLSVFLVTVRVEYVPVWEEEREARHMEKVQGQFAAMKSEFDRQAGNRTGSAVSHPLSLGELVGSRIFSAPSIPATLTLSSGTSPVVLATNELRIFEENGKTSFGAGENWTEIGGETLITDVDEVRHLRLRLDDPDGASDGDYVQVNITDADGDFAGQIRAYVVIDPPDRLIVVRTTAADGEILYDQGVSFHQVGAVEFWWLNALDDEKQFRDLLVAAEEPLTLDFVENGMTGEYTLAYTDSAGGGVSGNSGQTIPDYSKALSGGRLQASYQNAYFPSQIYTLEAGGVVLQQGEDAVMRIEPGLSASVSGTQTTLDLTMPNLEGTSDAVAAVGTATVNGAAKSTTHISGSAPRWSVSVTTDHPEAWTQAWADILDRAGLDAGTGEYTTATTPTQAQLVVYGKTTAPASTEHDINIDLTYGSIDVRLST